MEEGLAGCGHWGFWAQDFRDEVVLTDSHMSIVKVT